MGKPLEHARVNRAGRFLRVRRGDDEHVAAARKPREVVQLADPRHVLAAALFRTAPHTRHLHAECQPAPRDCRPDATEAEYTEPKLLQLAHRDGSVGEIFYRPPSLALRGDHTVEAASEIPNRRDYPIGQRLRGPARGNGGEPPLCPG